MALTKSLPATQPFEIRRSQIQGLGAYATRPIRKGMRVGEYVGERISQAESDRRYDDESMARHHTFLFTVTTRTVIDAAVGGNDTRFINHSCAPNCEAVIEDGRVFIDAVRAIPTGAELFYDYAYEREPDAGPEAEAVYPCRCGARSCRGTILAPLPGERRRPRPARPMGAVSKRSSGRPADRPAVKGSPESPARERPRPESSRASDR
jgi:SET domain-containing protein